MASLAWTASSAACTTANILGFADLNRYLVARCQQDAILTQLASELHTTIDVIRPPTAVGAAR